MLIAELGFESNIPSLFYGGGTNFLTSNGS
jgi:hypothetical protein